MKARTRIVLAVVLMSTPGLLGAVVGWTVAAGTAPGIRAAAPWMGAAVGFSIALIVTVVARSFTPSRPTVESDWRDRSRRIEESAYRNFRWMAKWAWALALPTTLISAVFLLAAGGGILVALLSAPIMFVLFWVAIRLGAIAGTKTLFLPKKPGPS
jgi:hypothetical protein